jgi:hypothetical protein
MRTIGDGKVAIYRWFEDGEGWAFHPWFSERGAELSQALDAILKSAPAGRFCVPALDGFLVGEHCEDAECADPKAHGRRPTLLRAAFLSRCPDDPSQERLLEALRAIPLPGQRRQDPDLKIDKELCERITFLPEASRNGRHEATTATAERPNDVSRLGLTLYRAVVARGTLLWLAVLLVVGGLCAVAAFQFLSKPGDGEAQRKHQDKEITPPVQVPRSDGTSVAREPTPVSDLETLTAGYFRKTLGPRARLDHPYVVFLKSQAERLPESVRVYQNRPELPTLLPGFGLRDNMSDDALAEAIAERLQYERWREGPGWRAFADRDKPLPEELRRFTERFRQPSPSFRQAAGQMAQLLQRWGEPEPSVQFAEQHPFTVIDRFFGFLTRPRSVPRPLTFDHPKVAFLWRLPADPVAEGLTFDNEKDLVHALRRLLFQLEGDAGDGETNVADLLARIDRAMSYRDWLLRQGKRTYVDQSQEPPEDVNRFVRRFER